MTIHLEALGLIVCGSGVLAAIIGFVLLVLVFMSMDSGTFPDWLALPGWLLLWGGIITFVIGVGMQIQFQVAK